MVEFKNPRYGKKQTYNPKTTGLFHTLKPGSKRKVKTAWNSIANVIKQQNLSQEAAKNLLGSILEGDMIEVF